MNSDATPAEPGSAHERAFTLAILALAFAARLALARSARLIEVDGAYWGGLARAFARRDFAHALHAAWPPLYPAATAGLAGLVAPRGPADPAALEWAARLVSVLAGTLVLLPLAALGRRSLPREWRRWVLLGAAVHPRLLEYSAAALSESLFTLLLVSGVAGLAAGSASNAGRTKAALGGAAFGLAFLVRPEGLLFGIASGATAALDRRARGGVPLLLATMSLVALPWLVFLHGETGAWTLGEKGAYNFWREHRVAWARHFPPPATLAARVNRSPEIAPPAAPGELRAAALLAAEPGAVLARTVRNAAVNLVSTLPVTVGAPVAVFGLLGLFLARAPAWLLVPLAFAPLLYAPFTTDRRLLVPVVPFALLLAGQLLPAIARGRAGVPVARAAAAALVLFLALWAAGLPGRRDPATELRAAGEWLGAHPVAAGRAPVVLARKPQVAFYAAGLTADLPAVPDSILAVAAALPADVIVVDARSARGDRPGIAPWLAPGHGPPGWRELARWPGEGALLLYGREPADSAGSMR